MLDFLFSGLFNLFGDLVSATMETVMNAFKVDSSDFIRIFPALPTLTGVLTAIGWALILLVFAISLMRSIMTPNDAQAEHPLFLCGRAVLAGLILVNVENFVNLFFTFGQSIYNILTAASTNDPGWAGFQDLGDRIVTGLTSSPAQAGATSIEVVAVSFGIGTGAAAILLILLLLIMAWQLLKFILECIQRYVTVFIGGYLAPLVVPTIGSKATSSIFGSYCSFMVGQMALLWISAWFMKIIVSGFESFGAPGNSSDSFFLHFFILFSIIVIAQKADDILFKLGFKSITGSGGSGTALLAGAAAVLGTALRVGRALGGGHRGGSSAEKVKAPSDPNQQNTQHVDSRGFHGGSAGQQSANNTQTVRTGNTAGATEHTAGSVELAQQQERIQQGQEAAAAYAAEAETARAEASNMGAEISAMSEEAPAPVGADTAIGAASVNELNDFAEGCSHLSMAEDYNAAANQHVVVGDIDGAKEYQAMAAQEVDNAASNFAASGMVPSNGSFVMSDNGGYVYSSPADPSFEVTGTVSASGASSVSGSVAASGEVQTVGHAPSASGSSAANLSVGSAPPAQVYPAGSATSAVHVDSRSSVPPAPPSSQGQSYVHVQGGATPGSAHTNTPPRTVERAVSGGTRAPQQAAPPTAPVPRPVQGTRETVYRQTPASPQGTRYKAPPSPQQTPPRGGKPKPPTPASGKKKGIGGWKK